MNSHYLRILSPRAALVALSLSLATSALDAQCQLEWQPGPASPGPNGYVMAMASAANDDLFVSGVFAVSGDAITRNIARYDGNSWHSLGSGIDGRVDALVILPNGDLIAGGLFGTAGNTQVNNIARWDGNDWFALGSGVDAWVTDMALLPNGNVVAVGDFTTAGGIAVNHVAVWNGSAWSALGTGPSVQSSRTVSALPNGNIVVGRPVIGTDPDLEIWDGTAWGQLNGVSTNELFSLTDLHALPNGDIAIVAFFNNSSPLAIWDGSGLRHVSPPFSQIVDLDTDHNGDLLVTGFNGPQNMPPVARFDGISWSFVGNLVQTPYGRLAVGPNSYHVARAAVTTEAGVSNIAKLQLGTWVPTSTTSPVETRSLVALADGDVLIGGRFTEIEGVAANNIARRTSTGYAPLAQGVDGEVLAMARAPDGSVVVGGTFLNAGGTPAAYIARWNGSSWSTVGAGITAWVNRLAINDAGEVLAAQGSQIMLFDGQSWSSLGSVNGNLDSIVALGNGDFLLGGSFFVPGQTPVANGMMQVSNGVLGVEPLFGNTPVTGMVDDGAGAALVTRMQNNAATIEHFDGTNLTLLASDPNEPTVRRLARMPNGDLLGSITSGASRLARWTGATWMPLAGTPRGTHRDVTIGARGEVFVAGTFASAGNSASVNLARAETTCPADVITFGSGCTGSAGAVALSSTDRPWTGATMHQTATGMASLSIGLHVIGMQTAVVPLPLGAPGCSLIATPDFVIAMATQNGEAEATLTIPNDPSLVAQQLFTQVVGIELDPSLAITQTTASNALQLTIGAF